MIEKIENKELIKKILTCLNKSDSEDFTEEDLASIENISLSPKLANGRETGLTVRDIFFFSNLKSLTLRDFKLSMDAIQLIANRKEIENLSFISCGFDDIDFDKIPSLPENLKFISCKSLPRKFPKVKKVDIDLSSVDFESISLESALEIIIRNSKVKNVHDIEKYENIIAVNLDGSELIGKNGEEIKDIKVSKNTLYSHEEEKRYETTKSTYQNEEDLER